MALPRLALCWWSLLGFVFSVAVAAAAAAESVATTTKTKNNGKIGTIINQTYEREIKGEWPLTVTFFNLGQRVELSHIQANRYKLTNSIELALTGSLLIKSSQMIDENKLKGIDSSITSIFSLFETKQSYWYLVNTKYTGQSGFAFERISEALYGLPNVLLVQPDYHQRRLDFASSASVQQPFLIESRAGDNLLTKGCDAAQCGSPIVAVIDSGFDFSHPYFADTNLLLHYNVDQKHLVESSVSGQSGHGTWVSGLILSAQKQSDAQRQTTQVQLMAIQLVAIQLVAIEQQSSLVSDMVYAFELARRAGAHIVNCSWQIAFLPQPLAEMIDSFLAQATPSYVVVAAGNNAANACEVNALSRIEPVLVIGAGDNTPNFQSNYGECVDYYIKDGWQTPAFGSATYQAFNGSSASAAMASGLLAKCLMKGGATRDIKQGRFSLAQCLQND